jgi:hypothetical protein
MLKQIFNNRKQILEGIKNNLFKKEHIEQIANGRLEICKGCIHYDVTGTGCLVFGTAPCCNKNTGGCGCSLSLKTRSLSSDCPLAVPKWNAVLTDEEEDNLNKKLK